MCHFKSGIILKNKCVIAQGSNDSHSDLLQELGIKDDYIGMTKTFVRAELIPDNNEWWINPAEKPGKWKFIVDQDEVPEWFDEEKYEDEFREYVCDWWRAHVLVDQKVDELSQGYYRLKRCEVKKLLNDVQVLCDSSTVQEMWGSSTVQKMYNSSTVQKMYNSSTVQEMWGSSTVRDFKNYPQIKIMVADTGKFEMVVFKNELATNCSVCGTECVKADVLKTAYGTVCEDCLEES